ncbi:MAG: hypothetical protein HY270_16470 [Deltaproteobacteria bacterium]|nr:hypothetical protein [Deltaproteobacteria bacterium]
MPKGKFEPSWTARWFTCAVVAVVAGAATAIRGATPPLGERIIDNLYSTQFVSANEGWTVGSFGSIFHTGDGGETWRPQASTTYEQLFGVSFADAHNGWIVGRTGLILHTANGGEKWERQKNTNEKHLFSVSAVDAQHVWAVGDWGVMLASSDGGQTWQDRSLDRDVILYAQSWPDSQHGWTVGEMGTVLVTSDGGQTWQDQASGTEKTLFSIHFADLKRGWACGLDGIILHSEDGGATWKAQRGNTEVGALEQIGVAEAMENASLYDITVVGNIGYAVGDIGSLFLSTDGGVTWARQEIPRDSKLGWIRSVSLVSGTHGMFVGANGLMIRIAADNVEVSGRK